MYLNLFTTSLPHRPGRPDRNDVTEKLRAPDRDGGLSVHCVFP